MKTEWESQLSTFLDILVTRDEHAVTDIQDSELPLKDLPTHTITVVVLKNLAAISRLHTTKTWLLGNQDHYSKQQTRTHHGVQL